MSWKLKRLIGAALLGLAVVLGCRPSTPVHPAVAAIQHIASEPGGHGGGGGGG